jgi:hypothetical protein
MGKSNWLRNYVYRRGGKRGFGAGGRGRRKRRLIQVNQVRERASEKEEEV